MELLGRYRLNAFAELFPRCREPFRAFACEVREATWNGHADIHDRYRSAQIGANGQVVFGFVEGLYLVETQIRFDKGLMTVKRAWEKIPKAVRRSSALN